MTQQYSLRWNNHQPNFISTFTNLLTTRTLVDVTLAADGKQLQAHKIVLSACSTYFQSLFVNNPSRHPIVILKDVTYQDLQTMVDFMYYGEVNVTEEQLPQVLETARLLKIKGLTEMPDSASLTRAQGAVDFQPGDSIDSQRSAASPTQDHHSKRKRRRKSSSTSPLELVPDDVRPEEPVQMDLVRADAITLSSVPQQRPRRDFPDERNVDNAQQSSEPNMNVEQMQMDANQAAMPQETSTERPALRVRTCRTKIFRRQDRVQESEIQRQMSDPTPSTAEPAAAQPQLHKHRSYPQYGLRRDDKPQTEEHEVRSLLIRTVTVIDRQASTSGTDPPDAGQTQRVRHTPAVRSGPPLSCNFCWNTVDECGRILRRKTQYHCPECRTNLCIVPCFHEYHDGAETDTASAR